VINIDILQLIDRLEELVDRGWRLPFGGKVAIDRDMFLNIIDQMRITIPQEIKQAKDIQRERDKYVAQAQEEARRIIAQAREDAAKELDNHKLKRAAEAQAEAILKRAQLEAARIRAGADEYAEARLKDLSQQVAQLQIVIQNGIQTLEARRIQQTEVTQAKQTATAATKPPQAKSEPTSTGEGKSSE
jgi:cell division septum initiation protein DivIVA